MLCTGIDGTREFKLPLPRNFYRYSYVYTYSPAKTKRHRFVVPSPSDQLNQLILYFTLLTVLESKASAIQPSKQLLLDMMQ